MFGQDGDDALYGREGDDRLSGGLGNDYITGWSGSDTIIGGAGNDYLVGDYDTVPDDEEGYTGDGADRIYGGTGNDYIFGGDAGGDYMSGGAGDDFVIGAGRLLGGAGNDWLVSQASAYGGSSSLNGGSGADTFEVYLMASADPFAARSSITVDDFRHAQGDQLHVTATVDTPLGVFSAAGADLFHAFDSNGSGVLGDGDAFAERAAGGGVVAHWFNADLEVRGDQTTAADWLS
jgi:Ca2+-binding RTX toxin-like protein